MKCGNENCKDNAKLLEGDCAKCANCKKSYHYKCSGNAESTFRRKSEKVKREWKCAKCRPKSSRNDSLERNEYQERENNESDKVLASIKNPELQVIYMALNKKMNEVIDSNEFLSKKYDELITKIENQADEIKI